MKNILYFFRGTEEKVNFILFSNIHIMLLIVALLGSLLILKSKKDNRKLEILIGAFLLSQQLILYSWYLITKYRLLSEGLPLYHCRIAIITMGFGLIFKKKMLIKIGSYWGIFGSISALLFVGLDPFYFPHMTQFSYFIGHYFLLWGAIYLLWIKQIGMNKTDYKNALIFTNIYHIAMFFFNKMIDGNYGYMSLSPIGIGNNLHPVVYGFIVMMIFNIVLTIEYVLCNKKALSDEEVCETEELLIQAVH